MPFKCFFGFSGCSYMTLEIFMFELCFRDQHIVRFLSFDLKNLCSLILGNCEWFQNRKLWFFENLPIMPTGLWRIKWWNMGVLFGIWNVNYLREKTFQSYISPKNRFLENLPIASTGLWRKKIQKNIITVVFLDVWNPSVQNFSAIGETGNFNRFFTGLPVGKNHRRHRQCYFLEKLTEGQRYPFRHTGPPYASNCRKRALCD